LDPPPPPKIAYLDSVRGLAALAVIGSHYVRAYDLPCRSTFCDRLLTYSPLHIAWDGGAAVSLFFVLSGLVLSLKHFRHSLTPDLSHYPLGAFILRRIFRIWPPYLMVLAISALFYQHYQRAYSSFLVTVPRHNAWLHSLWGRPAGWVDFFEDSFLLGMRMDMRFLPQAWTLSVELALSLLVPIGILVAARSSAWLVFFTLFAIHALGVSPFLFDFMLGILLAKHHPALTRRLRVQRFHRVLAWSIGLFLYTIGETFEAWINPNALGWLNGLGCGIVLLCTMASLKFQRILSFPTLRYLGKISYSIYLIHFAVLINATPLFLHLLGASDDGFIFAWWLGFAATLVVTVCLAGLSYRFVEVPSMAMGKRLERIARG
jgi:peptidoglycan/LPS O-acetylase OafA/YrhL